MKANKENRASTLLPIYSHPELSNKINFLSYWKLKNNHDNVLMRLSFRNSEGILINKKEILIDKQPKAYEICLEDFLKEKSHSFKEGFNSYVEVEVFFDKKPLIRYPALVYSICNKFYATYVHACLRSYNPDESIYSEVNKLDQTGFDVFFKDGLKNYIIFIGGESQEYYDLKIKIINSKDQVLLKKKITLKNNSKKKLFNIVLNDFFENKKLNNDYYKVLIEHDIKDIFPRFYVGNYSLNSTPSLTHTFFDESVLIQNDKNFFETPKIASSFIFPLLDSNKFISSISSYKSNKKWNGIILIKLIDEFGKIISEYKLLEEEFKKYQNISKNFTGNYFDLQKLNNKNLFCKYEFISINFPSRFKLGLNLGPRNSLNNSSNICFSPPSYNLELLNKKVSSSWCPVGGISDINVFFHNTDLNIGTKDNTLEVMIFSKTGNKKVLKIKLKADQTVIFNKKNKDVFEIIGDSIGYIFFRSSNPFSNCWYFSISNIGIGGDHSF